MGNGESGKTTVNNSSLKFTQSTFLLPVTYIFYFIVLEEHQTMIHKVSSLYLVLTSCFSALYPNTSFQLSIVYSPFVNSYNLKPYFLKLDLRGSVMYCISSGSLTVLFY